MGDEIDDSAWLGTCRCSRLLQMRFFPYERVVIESPLSIEVVLERLASSLDAPTASRWPWSPKGRLLRGIVMERQFAASPLVSVFDCRFGLLIRGSIEPVEGGTRILASLRYGWLGTTIMALLLVLASFMLGTLVFLLVRKDPLTGGTIPACVMPAILYLVIAVPLGWGLARTKRILADVVRP